MGDVSLCWMNELFIDYQIWHEWTCVCVCLTSVSLCCTLGLCHCSGLILGDQRSVRSANRPVQNTAAVINRPLAPYLCHDRICRRCQSQQALIMESTPWDLMSFTHRDSRIIRSAVNKGWPDLAGSDHHSVVLVVLIPIISAERHIPQVYTSCREEGELGA